MSQWFNRGQKALEAGGYLSCTHTFKCKYQDWANYDWISRYGGENLLCRLFICTEPVCPCANHRGTYTAKWRLKISYKRLRLNVCFARNIWRVNESALSRYRDTCTLHTYTNTHIYALTVKLWPPEGLESKINLFPLRLGRKELTQQVAL